MMTYRAGQTEICMTELAHRLCVGPHSLAYMGSPLDWPAGPTGVTS